MKIYLVRQARSVGRPEWVGEDDELRPLADSGRRQAALLASYFDDAPPTRVVSAPALRCQQTVQPLAARQGLDLEIDERLSRGEELSRVLELLHTFDDGPLMLCTHADVIAAILRTLELVDTKRPECRKGSVWVLEGPGDTPSHASYVEVASSLRRSRDRPEPGSGEELVRAAVLDLGSTSFNLLIADVSRSGAIAPVIREKVGLRLGAVIADGENIPEAVCERACVVAHELTEIARSEEVEHFLPVATAALRAARNGRRAAKAIGTALGHPIRILSGEEEARMIFLAFQHRLELGAAPILGLDLGGGSLELAVGTRAEIAAEATTELGAVRLHRELVAHDPMTKSEVRAIRKRVEQEIMPIRERLEQGRGHDAIATGGTVRGLMRMIAERTAQREPRRGLPLVSREALGELRTSLVRSSHAERLRMPGIRKSRADLLPVGALILEGVADALDLTGYRICDWGLREGVLLDALVRDPG